MARARVPVEAREGAFQCRRGRARPRKAISRGRVFAWLHSPVMMPRIYPSRRRKRYQPCKPNAPFLPDTGCPARFARMAQPLLRSRAADRVRRQHRGVVANQKEERMWRSAKGVVVVGMILMITAGSA